MINGKWAISPEFMQTLISVYEKRGDLTAFLKKEALTRQDSLSPRTRAEAESVAIISCYGPIIPFSNMFSEICGSVSIEAMRKQYKAALDNPKIEAILLDFNSPGGNVEEVAAFADEIKAGSAIKKTVAYAGGLCCSAAYWLASQCNEIYTDKTTETGSIGVLTWTELKENKKIVLVNSDSPKKALGIDTEEGQTEMLVVLNDLAAVFFNAVSAGRDMDIEDVKALEGRVFVGETALAKGLVDGITDFESLLNKLVSGEDPVDRSAGGGKSNERKNAMTADEQKAFDELKAKNAALENEKNKLAADLKIKDDEIAAAKTEGDKKAFNAAVTGKLAAMKAAGLKDENPVVANFKSMFAYHSDFAGKDWKSKIDAYAVPNGRMDIEEGDKGFYKTGNGQDDVKDAEVKATTKM